MIRVRATDGAFYPMRDFLQELTMGGYLTWSVCEDFRDALALMPETARFDTLARLLMLTMRISDVYEEVRL